MVKPQLGHDQLLSAWSLNIYRGGLLIQVVKSRFHCIIAILPHISEVLAAFDGYSIRIPSSSSFGKLTGLTPG